MECDFLDLSFCVSILIYENIHAHNISTWIYAEWVSQNDKKNRDERMERERERGLSKIKPPIIISTKGSVSRRQIDLSAISIKLKIVDINQWIIENKPKAKTNFSSSVI